MDMCMDICMDMCMDMCMDLCMDTCVDMCTDTCMDMGMARCGMAMCMDWCMDKHRHVGNMNGHLPCLVAEFDHEPTQLRVRNLPTHPVINLRY